MKNQLKNQLFAFALLQCSQPHLNLAPTQLQVRIVNDQQIEIIFDEKTGALLNFCKEVQPQGTPYFQFKGKTHGMDAATMTAYLTPDHHQFSLPQNENGSVQYLDFICSPIP